MLKAMRAGREARLAEIMESGYPAYTTSAGWLGYDDAKIVSLVREAVEAGFTHVKMKVGQDVAADARRAALIARPSDPAAF